MFRQLRFLLFTLAFLLPLSAQAQWFSSSQDEFLPVSEAFVPSAWHDGDNVYIGVEATEGYYLYRHRFALESLDDDVTLEALALPPGISTHDDFMGDVDVYRDQVVFSAPLDETYSGPLDIALTFQGCADAGLCYPPERVTLVAQESEAPAVFANAPHRIDTSASAVDAPRQEAPLSAPQSADGRFTRLLQDASFPLALGLFFLAGLGLTFTPCVLPMMPILSSIIVGQNPTKARAFMLSMSYVLGMALTYAGVGVLMGLFGAGLNLQAHLQSPLVLGSFAALFMLLAVAMLGGFDLRVAPRLAGRIEALQTRAQQSGPLGLAVAGALSVLVVSPCVTAPLAGALVFISSTGDAALGAAVLFALGLGMGAPLLLVGTLGTTLLPRTGAWMNGVKLAFGFLLLGVAIWMIERLVAGPVALLLWAALAIGAALTLGALTLNAPSGWARARQALGILLLTWGVAMTLGAAQGGNDPLRPLAALGGGHSSSGANTATQAPDFTMVSSFDALERALNDEQRPVFVHFTAEWCIACKLMERDVYPDPRVAAALDDYATIAVDVTHNNAESRELLDYFGLFGPPSLLFFDNAEELRPARVQGELSAAELADHLQAVSAWLAQGE